MQRLLRMRHRWVALVSLLVACDPRAGDDAGTPGPDGGDGGGGATRVRVHLELGDGELPSEWRLESLSLYVDEARANNDRGGTMEPAWTPRESVDIGETDVGLAGVPATYGGLTIRGDAGGAPTVQMELLMPEGERLELVSTQPYELALRCEGGPVRLAAAGEVTLRARMGLAALVEALVEASLPSAEDGVVTVDAARAPEALAAAERAFLDGWTLECEVLESD